jgi:predicted Zn-dependent protease
MKEKIYFALLSLIISAFAHAQQSNAFPLRTKIWKAKTISVCWDNMNESNKTERQWVQEAIQETWEKYSAIKFTDWVSVTQKDADVHIYISDESPKTIRLGTQIKGLPKGVTLNFSFNNWSPECKTKKMFCIKAIATHEFGHVLGFAHEQNKRECKFENCMEEPNGEDGDWHMNQCDSNSIMNYCNSAWNNNGLLSDIDIKTLQYFYHKPGNQSSLYNGFDLIYNSAIIRRKNLGTRKINHQINVFLVGDEDKLFDVEKVVYFLDDSTFKKPVITIRTPETNFGIGLRVWGEFMLVAIVFTKNGDTQLLKRFLEFNDNESK